ncbi:CBM35 domain-containing protein [Streptomyces tricolor]|uniref:CBM35 domain-containing protein n=2 Tax=Streptomyces TaxID=1883 RepID=UPI000B96F29E|nr:CBM35 domain-containing protein [Streptomyces sp. FBKL.4005]OYP16827.1 carbohydrate-binding protein [Streptomyces sp. FBKL.4005]
MTPGDNGASTPEDDDPFGYLYADGQARGAQPPSGGYGYPNSVSRVRTVGERSYGQQPPQAAYGQGVPQQQGAYGQPNAHYQAPETLPGGAPAARRPAPPAPGRRGPNTKGLLIGAIAVVAAVVIGIGIAMINGNTDDDKSDDQANSTPTQSQPGSPTPSGSKSAPSGELPKVDGADKSLQLVGGATGASDVSGARSADGSYIGGLNQAGASVTWTVNDIPKSGKYTVYVGYTVPGKDGSVTLMVNGTASERPVDLKNWRHAAEGDYEKGWTKTYNWIQLNKGTNTITLSCGQGNQCDALIDQMWLVKGWVNS